MHKIIIQFGLLVFLISVVFYSQMKLPVEQVILRSLTIFTVVSIMATILALIFLKSINQAFKKKRNYTTQRVEGANDDE